MKPIAPNNNISTMQILLSFFRVLSANVGIAAPSTYDGISVPLTYNQDNINNCSIRVGNATSSIAQKWLAAKTDTIINHTLNRIPIGYIVFRKSGPVDVYSGTAPWTNSTICLQTTDATIDTHIMVY